MFCPNCGSQNADNCAFCNECGCKLEAANNFAGGPTPGEAGSFESSFSGNAGNTGNGGISAVTGNLKKLDNKKIGIIGAAVVAVVIVIIAVIIFGGNGGSASNPFKSAAKKVDKDSSNYAVLNTLSCAYNTIFNSKSFSADVDADGDKVEVKVEFGSSLADSNAIVEVEDGEGLFALYDGTAAIGEEDYNGITFNFKKACKDSDSLVKMFFENNDMDDYYDSYGKDLADVVDDIIKGKTINDSAVFDFAQTFVMFLAEAKYDEELSKKNIDIEDIFKDLADIIKEADEDIFDVDADKNGKKTTYDISFSVAAIEKIFIEYIENNDALKESIAKAEGWDEDEIDENLEVMKAEFDFASALGYSAIDVSVTIEKDYITDLTVEIDGDEFSIEISDINKTKIKKADYEAVVNKFEDIEEYEDTDELVEEFF